MDLTQKQKIGLGIGAGVLLLLLIWILWVFLQPGTQEEQLPSIIEAGRPQYNFNDDSYIRENADLYLAQLVPLIGNLEGAVQEGNLERIHDAITILERGIVRWRDALENPTLITSVERYVTALSQLKDAVSRNDALTVNSSLSTLSEIKTLVIETQRPALLRLSQ